MKTYISYNVKLLLPVFFLILIFESSLNAENPIRTAVYADGGVGVFPGKRYIYANSIALSIKSIDSIIQTDLIYSKDIKSGKLNKYDVIIFPGGSGAGQFKSLSKAGRLKVQSFVKNGGGYIGICAGAYIGKKNYSGKPGFELSLMNATVYRNGKNWDRGAGIIKVELTNSGKKYLPELSEKNIFHVLYYNGPLLIPSQPLFMNQTEQYEEIIKFKTDIYHDNFNAKGDSPGTAFMVKGKCSKGTVILISGHPESTPGLRWILPRMVRVASRRKIAAYQGKYIKPNKYNNVILFTDKWKKNEYMYRKTLNKNSKPMEKVIAIKKLKNMSSWYFSSMLPGLLTDKSVLVKRETAKAIIFYDYFPALESLKNALLKEKDSGTKKIIIKAIKHLSH